MNEPPDILTTPEIQARYAKLVGFDPSAALRVMVDLASALKLLRDYVEGECGVARLRLVKGRPLTRALDIADGYIDAVEREHGPAPSLYDD